MAPGCQTTAGRGPHTAVPSWRGHPDGSGPGGSGPPTIGTPDPVNASAVFQAPDQAKIVHDPSADPDLSRYELRGTPGDSYDEQDAVTLATHTPADPSEFLTGFGLTQPGTRASFKVFVILGTGNEAGSPAMTVERPG